MAWYNFVQQLVSFLVFVAAHIYLLDMGVNLQALFRRHGHVKGYKGEIFIGIMYFFYLAYLILTLVQPFVILRIFTDSEYNCD